MISFDIKNQIIERTDHFKVVADSRDYLTAKFSFTEEWNGDITAIFGSGTEFYNVILSDNACTIPWEVIKAPFFTVSAVCGDRITTNNVMVDVEKSGYREGETPKPPTPDVYSQILSSTKAPYIGENGNWFEWDNNEKAFVDTGVKAEGYTPQKGTDYWTEEDKEEIKRETGPLIVTVTGNGSIGLGLSVSFEELRDVVDSGQEVILKHNNEYYCLSYNSSSNIAFSSVYSENVKTIDVRYDVRDVWYFPYSFELSSNKSTSMLGYVSNYNYPTTQAVADYVNAKTGDIGTALDNIIAIQNSLIGGDGV